MENLNNNKYINLITLGVLLVLAIISIALRRNLILIISGAILLIIYGAYIYIDEKRLLIVTVFLAILANYLTQFSSVFQFIPIIFTMLIIAKILEKKFIQRKCMKMDKVLLIATIVLFILDIVTILYSRLDYNIVLVIYALVKKYSFFIITVFIFNTDIEDITIKLMSKMLTCFCYINFIIILIQFTQGIRGDGLNGLLGINANGIVLQVFITGIIVNFTNNINKKKNNINMIILLSMLIIYSAIAEVKVGFVIILAIVACNAILKWKRISSMILLVITIFIISIGYRYLVILYPNMDFANKQFLQNYLTGSYNSTNSINRLGFMNTLEDTVILNKSEYFFGQGSGSLNNSSGVALLKGPINKEFDYLRIYWFSIPYIIVENGVVGLILIIFMYIYILIKSLRVYKKFNTDMSVQIIYILIVAMFMLGMYSQLTNIYGCIYLLWIYLSYFLKSEYLRKIKG